MSEIDKIKHLDFSEQVKNWFREKKILHYEIPIYERLLVGYQVMRNEVNPTLLIDLDDESKRLLALEYKWRNQIKRGGAVSQVLAVIAEAGGKIELDDLRNKLVDIGYDWTQSSSTLHELQSRRIVTIDKGIVTLWVGKKS